MSAARPSHDLGGFRGLLEAWRAERDAGRDTVLAVVTSTRGSTYRKAGALALFGESGLVFGALSGGCLEPEVERRAGAVLVSRRAQRAELDTEPESDRILGSGVGCRGRMDVLLLPVPAASAASLPLALERAFAEGRDLEVALSLHEASLGAGTAVAGPLLWRWHVDGGPSEETAALESPVALRIRRPKELLILGSGPESPILLALARRMGWATTVVEHRGRWTAFAAGADETHALVPAEAYAALAERRPDAVLVMTHSFELDLEHLRLWLASSVPFVGLLGPPSRRDDLLRELGLRAEELDGRLRAPVGLPLGGRGPEAIALSIVSELQQRWARDDERA